MAGLSDEEHDKAVGTVKRVQPGQKIDPVKPISEAEAVSTVRQRLHAWELAAEPILQRAGPLAKQADSCVHRFVLMELQAWSCTFGSASNPVAWAL